MNNQGVIQCKVKLVTDGEQQEMRRFQLDDTSFASNFELFRDKLRAVFPQLQGVTFKVLWTDSEGDSITIGNDEELLMAMMSMYDVKLLEVHTMTAREEPEEEGMPSFGYPFPTTVITCDVCNNRITRYRYKCLQCHDYDLCQPCEQAGNHSQHVMIRLADLDLPRGFPKMLGHWSRAARKVAHHAAKEAHRCAKGAAKAANQAAKEAHTAAKEGTSRCPYRQAQSSAGSAFGAQAVPFDTSVLFDMASSFLGPLMNPQTQGTAPAAPAANSTTPGQGQASAAATPTGAGSATPTPNPAPSAPAEWNPVDIGNILRDVFSAINANVAQAASGASTPAATQTPASTPAPTPVATPAPTPVATPAPIPVATPAPVPVTIATVINPIPVTAAVAPMEVEQPAVARTAPIYPSVLPTPDAGWTFVNTPPSAPASAPAEAAPQVSNPTPTAIVPPPAPMNPDEVKFAGQLGQLRRMGFSDSIDLLALLKRYNGNIGLVVNHLFEQGN